jgi:nucleoside-diphosphate-sugar epimerase
MERRLAGTPGLRALVLRAGDFFGPAPGNNWLGQGIVTPGKPVRSVTYPGRREVGHAWAYLPDVGETFARLLDVEGELEPFAAHHFAGYWLDGNGFVAAMAAAVGRENLPVRGLPWRLLPLIAPFNATMGELIEMESFWRHPLRLDNASLVAAIGAEPHTPLVQALGVSLAGLGCLDERPHLVGAMLA